VVPRCCQRSVWLEQKVFWRDTRSTRYSAQCTTMHYDALRCTAKHCNARQHTAMHCNTLQHTATHCRNARSNSVTWNSAPALCHYKFASKSLENYAICSAMDTLMQRTAMHCNALQCTATHCHTLQHTAMDTLADTVAAAHCNTHQHRVTHCNTLPTVEFSRIWPRDIIPVATN